MRRTALALAAAFALLPASGAPATSFSAAPPHDPRLVCKAIKAAIAGLNEGRLKDPEVFGIGPTFYSDRLGEIEEEEEARFLHSLRHSEGKPDQKPIGLYGVFNLHRDKEKRLYLVVLDRESWHETELVADEMFDVKEVANPGYRKESSFWLVGFWSNKIRTFRELGELYQVMSRGSRLKHCYQD